MDQACFSKAQLILTEKRTSLAVLRTGIMIFALPMTILTVLIALSRYYDVQHNLWLLAPIVIISTMLFLAAVYLIHRSIRNLLAYDRILKELRKDNPDIERYIPRSPALR